MKEPVRKMNQESRGLNDRVVKRRITFDAALNDLAVDVLSRELESDSGVEKFSLDPERQELSIHYDVLSTTLDAVLDCCRVSGCILRNNLRSRMRLGRYRFIDQNIRDNTKHQPHCCSKPPT